MEDTQMRVGGRRYQNVPQGGDGGSQSTDDRYKLHLCQLLYAIHFEIIAVAAGVLVKPALLETRAELHNCYLRGGRTFAQGRTLEQR
uniref:Uncharacterized protein n=1 Tax=Romanomermis culicivorax TaxID=13658 RepID=A0A915KWV4_ROMCU